ncbi:MAG: hypothetical protein Q9N34_06790 [Aquificota bacterium]|nr:hypothetical protein [Aquificota bacterium]
MNHYHRKENSWLPSSKIRHAQRCGDLFNSRQKLALITFTEKVRLAYRKMLEEGYEEDYAKAVSAYLGLGVDRLADYNSSLSRWVIHGEFIANTFSTTSPPHGMGLL